MMDCAQNMNLLLEYSSGKLSAELRAAFERHLRECPSCRKRAEAQQAVWEGLDQWQPEPVSDGFDRALYRKIAARRAWWRRWFGPLPLAAGASVAATTAALVFALWNRPAPAPVPPRPSVQVEPLNPEQAEDALQDMEVLRGLDGLAGM